MFEKGIPADSKAFIDQLAREFDSRIQPGMDDKTVWMVVGQRRLIEMLQERLLIEDDF